MTNNVEQEKVFNVFRLTGKQKLKLNWDSILTSVRRKQTTTNARVDAEKKEPFIDCLWDCELIQSLWNSMDVGQKTEYRTIV
jgi:hypothetical protein